MGRPLRRRARRRYELQDTVAINVAGIIEPALLAAETARSIHRPTADLTAYDLYLRALPHLFSYEKDRNRLALDLLGRAIERDPNFGPALALAALGHAQRHQQGWVEEPEADRRKGIELARRALRAAPDDPDVLAQAAGAFGLLGEDIDVAIGMIDRSLTLKPSSARGWYQSGVLRLFAGEPDVALEHIGTYLRLNPRDRLPYYLTGVGGALFFQRRFDEAAAKLLESLDRAPNFVVTYHYLASCYAHMGKLREAQEIVQRLRAIDAIVIPSVTPFRHPEYRELLLSGLRLAAGKQS